MGSERETPKEIEKIAEYEGAFKTVRSIDTISEKENKDWSLEDLEDKFLGAFKKVGEEALKENDGKIYTTLSGGVDSTLSLALLRKNFGPEVKIVTFTMGGNTNHPDVKYGRVAAHQFNTEHHEYIPTKEEIHEALLDFKKDRPNEDLKEAVEWGSFDVYLLYKYISRFGPKAVIAQDGIDEQMGGYWEHRKDIPKEERKEVFRNLWKNLKQNHLDQLIKSNQQHNIHVLFPYLDESLVKYISEIPVEDRASERVGKKPLKEVARRLNVPEEIINRPKRGAIGMTEIEELRESKNK